MDYEIKAIIMPSGKKVSEQLKTKIGNMTDMGVSDKRIAEITDLSTPTISSITTKYWNKKLEHLKI